MITGSPLIPIVLKWTRFNLGILSLISAGIIMSAVLAATAAVLWGTLREAALSDLLEQSGQAKPYLNLTVSSVATDINYFDQLNRRVEEILRDDSEDVFSDKIVAYRSETMMTDIDVPKHAPESRSFLFSSPGIFESDIISVDGSIPSTKIVPAIEGLITIEGVISREDASKNSLGIGDAISLITQGGDQFLVKVTGVHTVQDHAEDFLTMYGERLLAGNTETVTTIPVLLASEAFFLLGSEPYVEFRSTYLWHLSIVRSQIEAATFGNLVEYIVGIHEQLVAVYPTASLNTPLLAVLESFKEKLIESRTAMRTILILFVVFTFVYVFSVTGILSDRQSGYYHLLRLRGSGRFAPITVVTIPILSICVLAGCLGPVGSFALLKAVSYATGLSDMFHDIPYSSYFTWQSWVYSGVAVMFAFVILTSRLAARSVGRQVLQNIGSRGSGNTLKAALLNPANFIFIIAIVGFVATGGFGNPIWREMGSDASSTGIVVLLLPVLLLVFGSVICARLLPLVLIPIDYLLRGGSSAPIALSLKFLLRDSSAYAGVLVMLSVTVSIAVVSVSFLETLRENEDEQIRYQTGSDVRIDGVSVSESRFATSGEARYLELPWVDSASFVYRTSAYDADNVAGDPYQLMAIDMDNLEDVVWIRDDFLEIPAGDAATALKSGREFGQELPEGARSVSITVKPERAMPNVQVHARLVDSAGRFYSYRLGWLGSSDYLGNLKEPDWMVLSAPIKPLAKRYAPYSLISIGFSADSDSESLAGGSVLVKSITTTLVNKLQNGDPEVKKVVVQDFSVEHTWAPMINSSKPNTIQLTHDSSQRILYFSWEDAGLFESHGIRFLKRSGTVPALVTRDMKELFGYEHGQTFKSKVEGIEVNFEVVGFMDYFPTVNTHLNHLVLADLNTLRFHLNTDPISSAGEIDEVWINVDPINSGDVKDISSLKQKPYKSQYVYDRTQLMARFIQDPLRTSGWRILFTVSFLALFLLTTLYFWTRIVSICRTRLNQSAALENLGMTRKSINSIQWIESGIILVVGVIVGLWLGGVIGQMIMPILGQTGHGYEILPPYRFVYSWKPVAMLVCLLTLFCGMSLVAAHWFYGRYNPAETLRSVSDIDH